MKLLIISYVLVAVISAGFIRPYFGNGRYPLQPSPFGPGPHGFGSMVQPYNYRRNYNRHQHRRNDYMSFDEPFGYQSVYGSK
ncbi:unnamed protein product [Caenorhabditis angaria]|uniref:Uncharacterized protein n=1 Tax=Caenorhabditis angaria TaxID=860376 RepID=A0A9P1J2R9_9PELO|nr:unnamed protein product [Caenorhabditis angaria]